MWNRFFNRSKNGEMAPLLDKTKNKANESTVSYSSLPVELKHIIRDYLVDANNPQQLDILYPHSMSQNPSKAVDIPNYEGKEEGNVDLLCANLICINQKTVLFLSALALRTCGFFVDGVNYVKEKYDCHLDIKEVDSILPQRQKML